MKYFKTIAVAASLACAAASSRADITLDYSGLAGADIAFTGGNLFTFTSSPFQITASSGVGDSVSDQGFILGAFEITSINSAGTQGTVIGLGGNQLVIGDGGGHFLSANLTFSTIGQIGNGNILNVTGSINLSSISYTGTQSDLLALASAHSGVETVSFSFTSSPTLAQLAAGGIEDSYSGQISAFTSTNVLPEPTTVIAGALMLLPSGLGALRSFRKNSTSVE